MMKTILSIVIAMVLSAITLPALAMIYPILPEQCAAMRAHNVITDKNPIGCDRLVRIRFDYIDFNGKTQKNGEVVVLDVIADQVKKLFTELHSYGVPIAMARPMEEFDGDDLASMKANNTSAFNGRLMTGSKNWSKHAYGVAIDINPLQNPYVRTYKKHGVIQREVLPPQSDDVFLERQPIVEGMTEEMTGVFYKHGFLIWGGNWKDPIDYQHFEVGSRAFVNALINLPLNDAKALFNSYIDSYKQCADAAVNKGKRQRRLIQNACAQQVRQ
jgi:hypothetical protein